MGSGVLLRSRYLGQRITLVPTNSCLNPNLIPLDFCVDINFFDTNTGQNVMSQLMFVKKLLDH